MITKDFNLQYITVKQAKEVNQVLKTHGLLTENRVMLLCPPQEGRTSGGIILPDNAKDELPRKGILVQMGTFDDSNNDYRRSLLIGQKVTFGMYAGKEIVFEENIFGSNEEDLIPKGSRFTILSCNEIIYIENNKY